MPSSCETFQYSSLNGSIEGFRVRPSISNGRSILFCRGGNRNFGAIDSLAIETLFIPLAEAGFTVYGTQYSGGINSEGHDEFGGKDVADVLALYEVMRKDGACTDGGFLGLLGFSRGAINGCRATQQGLPVTRAAFVGGSFDLRNIAVERPDLYSMLENDRLFPLNPESLKQRSAVSFADELPQIPFLILHSEEDASVNVQHARDMATALGERATLQIFPDDDHGLLRIPEQRNKLLIDWFLR